MKFYVIHFNHYSLRKEDALIPVKNVFRTLILLTAGLVAVYMSGCSADDDIIDCSTDNDCMEVGFTGVHPQRGGPIATDTIITITFPYGPENLTVSAGVATVTGKTVKISGPFIPGPLKLIITANDETLTLYYTVMPPDTDPPTITGGTVKDGDKDVNHNAINAEARIELTFNEDVTGHVALQTQDGEDVGWIGTIKWSEATLELVKGEELTCGTTYSVVGKVSDDAGNSADFIITFTTIDCPL